jgi:hypothetical protein
MAEVAEPENHKAAATEEQGKVANNERNADQV